MLCEQLKSVCRTWRRAEKRIQDTLSLASLAACAGSVHCEKRVKAIEKENGKENWKGKGEEKDFNKIKEKIIWEKILNIYHN